jgi:hypothetical protein
MSDTQATRRTETGHDEPSGNTPWGWSAEPPATAATSTISVLPPPAAGWSAPVGLPIPLPPPVERTAASDLTAADLSEELTSLPLGWHTLASEQLGMGASGFEYIVIGPAGVFTVTTTGHPEGHISLDQHLRNSRFQAERATRLLDQAGLVDVYVQAAIVFVGSEPTLHTDSDVIAARIDEVGHTLLSLPASLTPLQVTSVYNIAERRETWVERVQPKG